MDPLIKRQSMDEFDRRASAGEVASTLNEEAKSLSDWHERNRVRYQIKHQIKPKTVANHIRSRFNAYKSKRGSSKTE